jgi:transcriptional regulator with XRE-family HTH domain
MVRDMKQKSILAHNICRIRTLRGLTQAGLAELAGLSTIAISHIETGHRWPRKETLKTLAKILKVSVDDLLSSENIKPRVSIENLTLSDAVLILEKIQTTTPLRRAFVLGVLFEDASLVPEDAPKMFREGVRTYAKAR